MEVYPIYQERMGKIMESHKLNIRTVIYICIIAVSLITTYIVWPLIFSNTWVEKSELLGLKNGMEKHDALGLLMNVGVKDILPRPSEETTIGKSNIADIDQLRNISVICVTSYVDNIHLKASFDKNGNVTNMSYGSVKKFDELSEKKDINDFISQLRSMIEHQPGLEAFSCIHDAQWIHVEQLKDANAQTLLQYDLWMFDEPSNQVSIKLRFKEGKLLKMEIRKQIPE